MTRRNIALLLAAGLGVFTPALGSSDSASSDVVSKVAPKKQKNPWTRSAIDLVRITDGDGRGKVSLRSRKETSGTRVKLRVRAEQLATDDARVHLEVSPGSGLFVILGDMTPTTTGLELKLDSKKTTWLPPGSDPSLAGHGLEVRSSAGALLLHAELPPIAPPDTMKAKAKAKGTNDEKAKLTLRYTMKSGRQKLRFAVSGLAPNSMYTLSVEAPTSGLMTHVDAVTADAEGDAELELRTQDGDPLPFGVFWLDDLAGLEFELIEPFSGLPVLSDAVPAF